jgi:CO dehydrogenase maturation factor
MGQDDVISTYAAKAPDGIDLIVMGKPADGSAGSGCMCSSHRAVRGLIAEMTTHGEYTVTDMEAGLEHLKRGTARNADCMLIVAEPYYRSLEAAMRTFKLARELRIPHLFVIANKVRLASDSQAIETFCRQHEMPIIATIPYEEAFAEAERNAQAPFDQASGSPGVEAIVALADRLASLGAPARPARVPEVRPSA